jgi:hypothetical protein
MTVVLYITAINCAAPLLTILPPHTLSRWPLLSQADIAGMSPSIELPTALMTSSTLGQDGKGVVRQRRWQELLQQQSKHQPAVKVVSPQELKGIVTRLSRSPGDPLPPMPLPLFGSSRSSGGGKQQQVIQESHSDDRNHAREHDEQLQQCNNSSTYRSQESETPALYDLLPQSSHGNGQGLPVTLGSKIRMGAAGFAAAAVLLY